MKITKYFIQNVPDAGKKAFKRFYMPIIFSIVATIFSIILIYDSKLGLGKIYQIGNMMMVLFAGIPLISFIFLLAEKFNFSQKIKCISGIAVTALIILYYFTLPEKFQITDTIRFIILSFFSALTFLSFPIFISKEKETTRKIWLFIFLKTAFAEIASLSLFAGLSLAVTAVKMLFFPDWYESYRIISSFAAISFGLVTPWIILASLPNTEKMSEIEITEKPFTLISKYVLVPAVIFYLIILYIYFGKVIILGKLPEGIVSVLILSFCGIGIMAYILILEEAVKGVTKIFTKYFFFSVTGLIVLLWYAVSVRIKSYGITENRYLLIIFSLFLTGWTLYFIISKRKNIIIITVTGAITAILISFGPLGIFETSFRSQQSRIIEILEKNSLIKNGQIIKAEKEITFETRKELTSALSYIEERWGFKRLSSILPQEEVFHQIQEPKGRIYSYGNNTDTEKLMKWMNLKTVQKWETKQSGETFRLYRKYLSNYTVEGPFNAMFSISCPTYDKEESKENFYKAEISNECQILSMYFENEKKAEVDILKVAQELKKNNENAENGIPIEKMTYKTSTKTADITIIFENIYGNEKDNRLEKITNFKADIFFTVKK